MNWPGWFGSQQKAEKEKRIERAAIQDEMTSLYNEIEEAKRDWHNALRHFEYAEGKDQIDYAIYVIEAAEKRYEMLLRKAKAINGDWTRPVREVAV